MGLASIMVRLGLDASGYQLGLKRAEASTQKFGATISTALKSRLGALFSVAAATAATRAIVRWADSIQDVSDDLGVSTRTLQEWEYAAEGTRAKLEDFTRAFEFLSRMNPTMTKDQVLARFNALAEAFKNGTLSLGELQRELGRGAAVLAGPFSRGLTDAAAEADKLNRFLTEKQIADIAKLQDAWDKAAGYAKSYFAQIALGAAEVAKYTIGQWKYVLTGDIEGLRKLWAELQARMSGKPWAREAEWQGPPLPPKEPDKEEPNTVTERTATSRWSLAGLTENQQVGAFSGAQPLLITEIKEQTRTLKAIERNTKEIEENG